MAATNTILTMEGIFKKRYASRVERAYPNGIRICKDIPYDSSKSPGDSFNQPVVLQHENGFTLAAPQAGSFTILDPVVSQSKNANIDGYQIVLSSEIDYESAAKASKKGERAFVNATQHVVKNMTDSHRKMLEIQALYGRADLGVVATDSTATQVISAATWSPGIFAGLEAARLDIYNSTLATETTGSLAVSSIDLTARTVTFASDPGTTVGDRVFFENAVTVAATPTYKEAMGIHGALTTSGSVFGISNSTYNLWKPSSVSAGGQLLFDHVQEIAARVAEKGGIDGKLRLYVSNLTWVDLLGDQAALRRYDGEGSTSKYQTGAQAICFHTATGLVEIVPSIYVKRGFAYLLELGSWSRIGAQDFAFGDPIDGKVFHRLETKAGADMRSYSNLAVFCNQLGRNGIITGIVNSAS
jgi:hypothetical protein